MKTIYLFRHAKAVDRETAASDFSRTLTKKGRKDAQEMGKRLRVNKRKIPELIVSSSALRALESAQLLAEAIGHPADKIVIDEALYLATAPELLEILQATDDSCKSVMLVGHNPGLTTLAGLLVKNFDENIKKAGIVCIRAQKPRWADLSLGGGETVFCDDPKK